MLSTNYLNNCPEDEAKLARVCKASFLTLGGVGVEKNKKLSFLSLSFSQNILFLFKVFEDFTIRNAKPYESTKAKRRGMKLFST